MPHEARTGRVHARSGLVKLFKVRIALVAQGKARWSEVVERAQRRPRTREMATVPAKELQGAAGQGGRSRERKTGKG